MNQRRVLGAVAMTLGAAGAAEARPVTAAACDRPAPTVARPRRAADVDWCNAGVGGMKGRLVRGSADLHLYSDLGRPHDTISTTLRSVDYGDVDGDGRAEAVLVIERTTWIANRDTSSSASDVLVYAVRRGRPVQLGSIPAGTPVTDLTIARGRVTLVSGPDGATTAWRWRRARGEFAEVRPTP